MYRRYLLKNVFGQNKRNKTAYKMTNSQIYKYKEYRKFIDYFIYCPVCHRKNDELYLSMLYFSTDPRKIKIKKFLLKLMISSKVDGKKVILGIPCCTCFDIHFNNRSTRSLQIPSSSNHSFYRR